MKIEISPRRSGKTERMIAWVRSMNTHILVTFSEGEASRLRDLHPDIAARITTLEGLKDGSHQGGHSVIGIDNVDLILQKMVHPRIEYISFGYSDGDTITKYENGRAT